MEDAYTIGIRLALDDGVSAGIAAISGDLATLDRAVAATTGSLARLSAFAGGATHPAAAESQRFARQAEQFVQIPQPPAADASPPPTLPPRTIETPPPATVSTTAAMPTTAAPRLNPAAPTQTVQLTVPPPAAAPVLRIHVPAPTLGTSSTPTAAPAAPLAIFAPPQPPRDQPAPLAAAPTVDVQQHFVTNQAAPAVLPTATASSKPLAPRAPTAARSMAPIAATEPQLPSVAPPPQAQASTGPSHGDVFLDGMRVGRWMSDNLAREATRPQAGNTGFDPRIGPTWPGTLQGS